MADPARTKALALVEARGPDKTVCPSEVAKALAGESWRAQMDAVHAAVDALVAQGRVTLSWQGEPMARRSGPYRIRLASSNEAG